MHINLDINKTLKNCIGKARTDLYVWKDLEHLKSYYADAIDGETIDRIADEVRNDGKSFKYRKFKKGKNLEAHLNERCFCNLVEMKLIDQSNAALKQFLERPLFNESLE